MKSNSTETPVICLALLHVKICEHCARTGGCMRTFITADVLATIRYSRPSKRGGRNGKREIVVSSRYLDQSKPAGRATHRSKRRPADGARVPYIRLSGHWLEELGFREGDRLEITSGDDCLVLRNLRDDSVPVSTTHGVSRGTRRKRPAR